MTMAMLTNYIINILINELTVSSLIVCFFSTLDNNKNMVQDTMFITDIKIETPITIPFSNAKLTAQSLHGVVLSPTLFSNSIFGRAKTSTFDSYWQKQFM